MKESKLILRVADDWCRRKPLILSHYLEAAIPKLASLGRDRSIYVVDSSAGRGYYEDGAAGSAIQIAKLSERWSKRSNPTQLRVRNIEPDDDLFAELNEATQRWTSTKNYRNIQSSLCGGLPAILAESIGRPLYALIDPFAQFSVSAADLQPLWRRGAPTEALIAFHSSSALRMLRQAGDTKTSKPIRLLATQRLDSLFGNSSWMGLDWRKADIHELAQLFQVALAERFKARAYSHLFTTRTATRTKYHVVFLTRQNHDVALMNDAFVKESALIAARGQVELDLYAEQRWNDFMAGLLALARAQPGRVWIRRELVQHSIAHTFGVRKVKDHLKVIEELIALPAGPRLLAIDATRTKSGEWRTNETTLIRYTEK